MKIKAVLFCVLVCLLFCCSAFSAAAYSFPGSGIVTEMRYRSHSSNSSSNGLTVFIFIAVLIVVIISKYLKYKSEFPKDQDTAAHRKLQAMSQWQPTTSSYGEPKNFTEQITGQIRKRDLNFSADKFIWLIENYFIAYMDAYNEQDLELLEKLTTEDIFFIDKADIEDQLQNGVSHKRKRISFQTDYLYKYEYNDKYEYVSAYIKSRMIDYMENNQTGESYYGSKSKDVFTFYTITLRRKLSEKTIISENVKSIPCPNCGAPMDAVVAGRCSYCGKSSMVTDSPWKISAVRKTELGDDLGRSGIFRIT